MSTKGDLEPFVMFFRTNVYSRHLLLLLLLITFVLADAHMADAFARGTFWRSQKPEQSANANSKDSTARAAEEATLNAEMVKLYKEHKYDEAIVLAKQVLALKERDQGATELGVVNALNNLAALYIAKGKYSDAEPFLKRSLGITETKKGLEHPGLASILDNLALISYASSKYGAAENFYQRALAIREKNLGATNPEVMKSYSRLADYYEIRGDYKKAEPLLQHVVEVEESSVQLNHNDLADSLYQYACLKRKTSRKIEAEQLEARADGIIWPGQKADPESLADEVINGKAIQKPVPIYPMEAKEMHQDGKVTVQIMVDESGKVLRACAISGPSVFWRVTENAAYRAIFSPTLFQGKPVKVRGIITYNFVLR